MLCFCVQASQLYAAAEARNPAPALRMLGLRRGSKNLNLFQPKNCNALTINHCHGNLC